MSYLLIDPYTRTVSAVDLQQPTPEAIAPLLGQEEVDYAYGVLPRGDSLAISPLAGMNVGTPYFTIDGYSEAIRGKALVFDLVGDDLEPPVTPLSELTNLITFSPPCMNLETSVLSRVPRDGACLNPGDTSPIFCPTVR